MNSNYYILYSKLNKTITEKLEYKNIDDINFISSAIEKVLNKKGYIHKLLYRASRDGDSSQTFHNKCDGIPNTVIIIETTKGKKFGGFTSQIWDKKGDFKRDENCFLFNLNKKEIYYIKNSDIAILCSKNKGPNFGSGSDICIEDNCMRNNNNFTFQSSFYYKEQNYALNGEKFFTVKDYDVYQVDFGDYTIIKK
jgi:hypothetical protein